MQKIYLMLLLLICCSLTFAQKERVVSILGDSYSTFEGYIPSGNQTWYTSKPEDRTDVHSVGATWWNRWLYENKCKLGINNSYSGATICDTGYDKHDYSDRSFVTRLHHLGHPDLLFIMGGTNDSWAGSPIGSYKYEKWTKEDLYQFRPAMAYMLHSIRALYPKTKVYFLLNSDLKPDINVSIVTICRKYGVPCLELKKIDKKNGHPTVKGMAEICAQLNAFMKEYK